MGENAQEDEKKGYVVGCVVMNSVARRNRTSQTRNPGFTITFKSYTQIVYVAGLKIYIHVYSIINKLIQFKTYDTITCIYFVLFIIICIKNVFTQF